MKQTFNDYVMRESVHDMLRKAATEITGNIMFFGTRAFILNEHSADPDYIEGEAESRDDASKIMKLLRKKGIPASRYGATGIQISKEFSI
jgi:hypothetical protein